MRQNRRRYPRVDVVLDSCFEALGTQSQGKTIDLSGCGVKVASPSNSIELPQGTSAELGLSLPDGDSPLALRASVVRTDADGMALNFVDLEPQHFQRIKTLVDSRLQNLSRGPRPEVIVKPGKELGKPLGSTRSRGRQ